MRLSSYLIKIVSLITIIVVTVAAFASRAKASYTYFYDDYLSSVVRYDPYIDVTLTPTFTLYLEANIGGNWTDSGHNFGADAPYRFLLAIGGDDWDPQTIGGIDYVYDTSEGLWYVDAGYISAASAEGYSLILLPPESHFTYYGSYASGYDPYDYVHDQWYDEGLINPDTNFWQAVNYDSLEAPIIGGDSWVYYLIDDVEYAYDTRLEQWYQDADDDINAGNSTKSHSWVSCEAPELENYYILGGNDWTFQNDPISHDPLYAYDSVVDQWYCIDSDVHVDNSNYTVVSSIVAEGLPAPINLNVWMATWTPCADPNE